MSEVKPVQPTSAMLAALHALSVNGAPLDISQAYVRKEVAKVILQGIDNYAVKTYHDGDRKHLGASLIGEDCTRKVFYGWRWMIGAVPTGKLLRLFNRGHREEARYIEYLVGIGFTVWEHNPETGQQFRVSRLNGHFGGSLDSILKPPAWLNMPDILFLGEYKTKSTNGFDKLKKDGLMLSSGQHYDQMCTYGRAYGYQYAMYFSTNKNDDDMHVEIVPLNWRRADEVEAKAAYIIGTQKPPPKISLSETHWKCRTCDCLEVCHRGKLPARNCRSCVYAVPVDNAQWNCTGWQTLLTDDVIKVGCDRWTPIL